MYIYESVCIGLYVLILYKFLRLFQIKNIYVFLFVLGVLKHYISYLLNIHTYYCKYGNACKKYMLNEKKKDYIIVESIGEGILFIIVGQLIFYMNKELAMFLIGFSLHFLFEIFGIHDAFCLNRCV